MKNFALKTFALILFVSTFVACSNDDGGEAILVKRQSITAVEGLTEGIVGQEITLTVSYEVDNACGVFERFSETVNGNSKTINIEARYTGADCGNTVTTKTQTYKVTIIQAGTYVFKFRKSETEFVTHTIVIS
ncbi:hypothetical protein ACFPVY_00995 [Flavobacterium qiangtangense]|uniref:GOLD domain-containing protein n=1 Tax=Flavobacterium qiangtangense TaxID=1442595 RepID=A0ABW1PJF6_9FLAO